ASFTICAGRRSAGCAPRTCWRGLRTCAEPINSTRRPRNCSNGSTFDASFSKDRFGGKQMSLYSTRLLAGARLPLLAGLFAVTAAAQLSGPDVSKRLADLEKAAKAAQMAGDNAWMLTSSALVLMMTGPGLALFYCGLVRRKNVLGTMMHSFVLMGLVTIIWAVVGYSLAFSEGSPFVGSLRYLFLNGVGADPNT